jgi:hypothetical protein
LEVCGCDINNSIYAFIPTINDIKLYTNNLHTLPQVLDSSISLFTGKKPYTKKSIYFIHLKKNEDKIMNLFSNLCEHISYKGQKKIGQNEIEAALSCISCIYLNTYVTPIQFFLPHSSACSGKWEFWESIDFFGFSEKLQNKEFIFDFRDKIMKNKVWNIKFDLKYFPPIVQRRLLKERLLDKKLNPEAMIKALIIKLGEMGRPFINYEAIDFSIREFFTYLGTKKYLRVDREMEFLNRLDKDIVRSLKESLGGQ